MCIQPAALRAQPTSKAAALTLRRLAILGDPCAHAALAASNAVITFLSCVTEGGELEAGSETAIALMHLVASANSALVLSAAGKDAWASIVHVIGSEGGLCDDTAVAGSLIYVLEALHAHQDTAWAPQRMTDLSGSPVALARCVLMLQNAASVAVPETTQPSVLVEAAHRLLIGCLTSSGFDSTGWLLCQAPCVVHWLFAQTGTGFTRTRQMLAETVAFDLRYSKPSLQDAVRQAELVASVAGGPAVLSEANVTRACASALGRVDEDVATATLLVRSLFLIADSGGGHDMGQGVPAMLALLAIVPEALQGLVLVTSNPVPDDEDVVLKATLLLVAALQSVEAARWLHASVTQWVVGQVEKGGESQCNAALLCVEMVQITGGPAALAAAGATAVCSNAAIRLKDDNNKLAIALMMVVVGSSAASGSAASGSGSADQAAAEAIKLASRPLFSAGSELTLGADTGDESEGGIASPFMKVKLAKSNELKTLNVPPPWMTVS